MKKMQEQEYEMTPDGTKCYNICGMRFETTPNYAVKKAVGQVRRPCQTDGARRACVSASLTSRRRRRSSPRGRSRPPDSRLVRELEEACRLRERLS